MKTQKMIMTVCVVFLSVPGLALAQENEFARKPFFGIDLGFTKVKDHSQEIASGLVGSVGGSATASQDTTAYEGRLFGGYKLTENIDLEIGYTSMTSVKANLTGVGSNGVAYTGGFSVSVSGVDYAALLRPSLSSGYNNFYVRVGGTNYTTKSTGSVNGVSVVSDSKSGMGYQYGFGYDAVISQDIMYRLAFTRVEKVAGESGSYANVFSVGFYKGF